jgi:membrane protease YdiL (CAAX protease family)
MATVDDPRTHSERLWFVLEAAGIRYATIAVGVILGLPLVAFLSGDPTALFYVHVGSGAFRFGLDFFFRYVMASALEAAGSETAGSVVPHLTPKIMVIGESLTLGTIGSGIGLASLLGYWATPSIYLWGALVLAGVMIAIAFGPLHSLQTAMLVELASAEPDGSRVSKLDGRTLDWLLGTTGLMLVIIWMMTGLRGLLPPVL